MVNMTERVRIVYTLQEMGWTKEEVADFVLYVETGKENDHFGTKNNEVKKENEL